MSAGTSETRANAMAIGDQLVAPYRKEYPGVPWTAVAADVARLLNALRDGVAAEARALPAHETGEREARVREAIAVIEAETVPRRYYHGKGWLTLTCEQCGAPPSAACLVETLVGGQAHDCDCPTCQVATALRAQGPEPVGERIEGWVPNWFRDGEGWAENRPTDAIEFYRQREDDGGDVVGDDVIWTRATLILAPALRAQEEGK